MSNRSSELAGNMCELFVVFYFVKLLCRLTECHRTSIVIMFIHFTPNIIMFNAFNCLKIVF